MKKLTASQAIKKDLKKAFPEIKFSVRGDYNSVTISYENGPSESVLSSLLCDYKAGHFDSSTDCYEYTNRKKDIPQVKYVFYNRNISKELIESTFETLKKTSFDMKIKAGSEYFDTETGQLVGNSTHGEYVFHSSTYSNSLIIEDKEFWFTYQNGISYNYQDYDCPSNNFRLNLNQTDRLLRVIYELGDATAGSFKRFEGVSDERIQERLDEIEEIYSIVDSPEKASKIYEALCNECPTLDLSTDVDDYEFDEDGFVIENN